MDDRANVQTQIIERDLEKLNTRFDRHLEIYAQNGKELASLKSEVHNLTNAIKSMDISNGKNNDNQWVQIKTNTDDISTLKVEIGKIGTKVGIWAGGIASVASAGVGLIVELIG